MQQAGIAYPKDYYRARAWADWGARLLRPVVGAVVVYDRGKGAGHVGLAVGRTPEGNILTLGGNQGDSVSIVPIAASRLIASRWPTAHLADWAWHLDSYLPLLASFGANRDIECTLYTLAVIYAARDSALGSVVSSELRDISQALNVSEAVITDYVQLSD
jgi:hypothetical protein